MNLKSFFIYTHLSAVIFFVFLVTTGCKPATREAEPEIQAPEVLHSMEELADLFEQREWEAAETMLRAGVQELEDPVFKRTLLGISLSEQDRLQEARELFMLNVQAEPDSGLHAYNVGAVMRRMGEPGQALDFLAKAIELGGTDPILAAYNWRLALIELGRADELLEKVNRALDEEPPGGDWLMTAAAIALSRGFFSEAAELLDLAGQRLDSELFSELMTDRFFREFANHPDLARFYTAANPQHRNLIRAANRLSQGDFDAAIEFASAALDAGEPAFPAHSIRALAYFLPGQFSESLSDFAKAVELEPENSGGWLNYGEALRAVNRPAEARNAFAQAVALQPQHPLFAFKLGLTHVILSEDPPASLRSDAGVALSLDLAAALQRGEKAAVPELLESLRQETSPGWLDLVLQDPFFREHEVQ